VCELFCRTTVRGRIANELLAQFIKLFILPVVRMPAPTRTFAQSVKVVRTEMGLTQQGLAALLGLSVVSINKWENGASEPTGLSAVLLQFLQNALRRHGAKRVLETLRPLGGVPLEVVRTLATLERS
jgi:hypothetical protein